jgi:hypothetical protein
MSEQPTEATAARPVDCGSDDPCGVLLAKLGEKLAFQAKWRFWCSMLYWATSISSIAAAATATLLASLGISLSAAIAAAVATVVASLEKALGLREKWSHHRSVETELELVQLNVQTGEMGLADASAQLERIARRYAVSFPLGGPEERGPRPSEEPGPGAGPPSAPAEV